MHGTTGVVGVNTQANLFGIPGTPSFGDVLKKGVSLIPGVGPIISEFIPTGGPAPVRPSPLTGGSTCIPPFFSDGRGGCVLDVIPGGGGPSRPGQRPPAATGEAVVGRYGVAMEPGLVDRVVRVCLDGMQLAKDGLCYNKGVISNAQRAWPKGRAPLLTGGEMRAISTATRAAGKLERTTKRLQKTGLLKKPSSRRAPRGRQLAPVGGRGVEVVNVS